MFLRIGSHPFTDDCSGCDVQNVPYFQRTKLRPQQKQFLSTRPLILKGKGQTKIETWYQGSEV